MGIGILNPTQLEFTYNLSWPFVSVGSQQTIRNFDPQLVQSMMWNLGTQPANYIIFGGEKNVDGGPAHGKLETCVVLGLIVLSKTTKIQNFEIQNYSLGISSWISLNFTLFSPNLIWLGLSLNFFIWKILKFITFGYPNKIFNILKL